VYPRCLWDHIRVCDSLSDVKPLVMHLHVDHRRGRHDQRVPGRVKSTDDVNTRRETALGETYITPAQIQERGLEMMKFFDEICRREKLTYWLSGGTLLGAVRHKGFIPWDDDVDLMMPRPDYDKLVAAADRLSTQRYAFAHPMVQKDYGIPWMRLLDCGTHVKLSNFIRFSPDSLFADIFPVDALPANPRLCKLFFTRSRLRHILWKCSRKTNVWPNERLKALKRALTFFTRIIPPNTYARWLDHFCARGDYESARFVGVAIVNNYGSRERMPRAVIEKTVYLPFCDGEFPAPAGWNTYLCNLYGDYMQLPPEEQRVPKHKLRATIID